MEHTDRHAPEPPRPPATEPAATVTRRGATKDRPRRRARTRRLLATREVRESIVSLAGLIGRPVRNQIGEEIGRMADVVCRWDDGQTYPPVTGLVVRIGRRIAYVPAGAIASFTGTGVELSSARLDLTEFRRREGEVTLVSQVLDHQLVDVDGVKVIRAADLYLAPVLGRVRLVGVDVSMQSLLRRLGPTRWKPTPTPDRVIDWAAIEHFGEEDRGQGPQVRLRTTNAGLERLRPGELADLLEDLMRPERQQLLDSLPPEEAADALEEMDPEELLALLRESTPERSAELLVAMEPDEAVDALRDLSAGERDEIFAAMPGEKAAALAHLLDYPEDQAAGIMTTSFVTAATRDTVAEVVERLRSAEEPPEDLDGVAVVDSSGRFVWDLPLVALITSGPDAVMRSFVGESEPVAVLATAGIEEVADRLVEARRPSVVVVDEAGAPIGRIHADDVLDARVPDRSRFHFPRLLQ